jgi:hypothetical protein
MLGKKILLICIEGLVIASLVGCAPTFVSTDAAVYQHGTLYASAGKDLDSVYAASISAMDKLQLQVTEKAKDVFAAKIIAKSADDKMICIKMKPNGEQKTSFEIHVGAFGDEEMSRRIFTEMGTSISSMKAK